MTVFRVEFVTVDTTDFQHFPVQKDCCVSFYGLGHNFNLSKTEVDFTSVHFLHA